MDPFKVKFLCAGRIEGISAVDTGIQVRGVPLAKPQKGFFLTVGSLRGGRGGGGKGRTTKKKELLLKI